MEPRPLRPIGPCHPPALPSLSHLLFPSLPAPSPLGIAPEQWSPATLEQPFTCSSIPALQVPEEHADLAQGSLRPEEPDTQA